MRIGMLTHYMPPHNGGIERVAEMLFTAYAQRGFEVRWVASRDPAGVSAREGQRVRVPCWNGLERRLGVPVPLWGPAAWREVHRLARWADALHVHDCLYPGSALAALFGRCFGKPVLLTQHIGFIHYRAAALRAVERLAFATLGRWVLRRSSRLALATPAAEGYVAELLGGFPPNACVIPNGVDTERFHPASPREREAAREQLGLPINQRVALFVGRLVEKKGIDLVVEVSQRLPAVQFLAVGDGPLAEIVSSRPNVRWHRSIAPDRIHTCYHASHCFLLPSHGEGLPVVVQEAAACGLPILVSEGEAYSGPLAEEGVCVTAPRLPEAIAGRLEALLSGTPADLGARARRYAASHWSMGAMADRYVALLQQALSEKGEARHYVHAH